jgi:hypothetical protein
VTPENAASTIAQTADLTPENAELLSEYAGHLKHSPLSGHSPRTYLGAVRAYLTWLGQAEADGDPLNDAAAKDWAVRDYRSYLVTVAKRATATVNKHLAALQDFYVWRGLGQPQGVKRHQVARHAPKALSPRAKVRYLRAVEAWPSARDRAIALLPLYAGTRIAEIAALDVADVCLSARKTPQGLSCQIGFVRDLFAVTSCQGRLTLPAGQVPDGPAIRGRGWLLSGHAASAASGVSTRCDHAVASSYSRPVFRHPCRMPVSRLATRRIASSWPTSRARRPS